MTRRSKNKYSSAELIEFIKKIINKNEIFKIYDRKRISIILYKALFLVNKKIPLSYILSNHLVFYYLKILLISLYLNFTMLGDRQYEYVRKNS